MLLEPLHFGEPSRPLFGLRFAPTVAARRTAILLCPSFGMEYMRSYRALSLLGQRLADSGFDTLRFDYSCTGDSSGQSGAARLEQWLTDVGDAAREQRATTECSNLCLIGLRLGALIAGAAVEQGLSAEHLVYWDAPRDGRAWVEQIRGLEPPFYARKNQYRPKHLQLDSGPGELLGTPVDPALCASLLALAPARQVSGTQCLNLSSADQDDSALPAMMHPAPSVRLPDAAHWDRASWLTTPWTPAASLERVTQYLTEILP